MHHSVDPNTVYPCWVTLYMMWHYFQLHHHQNHWMICTNEDYTVMPIDCSSCAIDDDSATIMNDPINSILIITWIWRKIRDNISWLEIYAYMFLTVTANSRPGSSSSGSSLLLMANMRLWSWSLWTFLLTMFMLMLFMFRPSNRKNRKPTNPHTQIWFSYV